jgi:hypothetical protein
MAASVTWIQGKMDVLFLDDVSIGLVTTVIELRVPLSFGTGSRREFRRMGETSPGKNPRKVFFIF